MAIFTAFPPYGLNYAPLSVREVYCTLDILKLYEEMATDLIKMHFIEPYGRCGYFCEPTVNYNILSHGVNTLSLKCERLCGCTWRKCNHQVDVHQG